MASLLPWSECEDKGLPVLSLACAEALNVIYPSVCIVACGAALLIALHVLLTVKGLELLIGKAHVDKLRHSEDVKGLNTDVISKKRAGRGLVKLHTTVQDVTTSCVSTTLFAVYLSVVLDNSLNASPETRLYGTSEWTVSALRLHLACTVYELTLYAYLGKDLLSYLHHAVVIFNYCRSLRTGMMHFYGTESFLLVYHSYSSLSSYEKESSYLFI